MRVFSQNALNELPPPPECSGDSAAKEVLRAWIVKNGLSVSLSPLSFESPAVWGMLLVDVARHVARSYEQEGEGSYDDVMRQIRYLFDHEWDVPTDLGTTNELKRQ